MSSFVEELRRRHVVRVATAYAVTSWLILQSVDVVFPILGLDEALGRPILAVLLVGRYARVRCRDQPAVRWIESSSSCWCLRSGCCCSTNWSCKNRCNRARRYN